MRKAAVDWTAVKRIGAGSGLGSLAFVLANRYLLGNKSLRSGIISGALGAGVGGLAGLKYHQYKAPKELEEYLAGLNQKPGDASKVPDSDPERVMAVMRTSEFGSRYADYLESQAQLAEVVKEQAKTKSTEDRLKAVTNSKLPVVGLGYNKVLSPSEFASLEALRTRVIPRSHARASSKTTNGALNQEHIQVDWNILKNKFGENFNMTLPQYTAARYYHELALDAYNGLAKIEGKRLADADPGQLTAIVDYCASASMPKNMLKQLPLKYRYTAMARAQATYGAAYHADNFIYNMPGTTLDQLKVKLGADRLKNIGDYALLGAIMAATGGAINAIPVSAGSKVLPWAVGAGKIGANIGLNMSVPFISDLTNKVVGAYPELPNKFGYDFNLYGGAIKGSDVAKGLIPIYNLFLSENKIDSARKHQAKANAILEQALSSDIPQYYGLFTPSYTADTRKQLAFESGLLQAAANIPFWYSMKPTSTGTGLRQFAKNTATDVGKAFRDRPIYSTINVTTAVANPLLQSMNIAKDVSKGHAAMEMYNLERTKEFINSSLARNLGSDKSTVMTHLFDYLVSKASEDRRKAEADLQ